MVINHEQINKNLENAKNKSISQKVLSELVNNGIDRDNAYRSIQNLIFENISAEELVKAIETMAEEKNITSSQLALAWIISKGILPIPGTKRRKYLEENITATEIELNEADLLKLESIVPLGTDTGNPYDEFSMGLID